MLHTTTDSGSLRKIPCMELMARLSAPIPGTTSLTVASRLTAGAPRILSSPSRRAACPDMTSWATSTFTAGKRLRCWTRRILTGSLPCLPHRTARFSFMARLLMLTATRISFSVMANMMLKRNVLSTATWIQLMRPLISIGRPLMPMAMLFGHRMPINVVMALLQR